MPGIGGTQYLMDVWGGQALADISYGLEIPDHFFYEPMDFTIQVHLHRALDIPPSLDGSVYAAHGPLEAFGDNPVDALNWGTVLAGASNPGTLIIPVYFQPFSQDFVTVFIGEYDARDWTAHELQQMWVAFAMIESVIDVEFVEVNTPAEAVFHLTVFRASTFLSAAGLMYPPEEGDTPGYGYFNRRAPSWDENGEGSLLAGGAGFKTILHELGHGLGLAHPHDGGGASAILRGVEDDPQTDTGDFGLSQDVFTIMSYVDGWAEGPNGLSPSNHYGWTAGFSPLDIAHLQLLYGANPNTGSGDTLYILPASNDVGTSFSAIWDVGGTDTIITDTAEGAVINLNPASLEYEIGGGGFISYNLSIIGGFTIANGVIIENAIGGIGADTLIGNAANNRLEGQGGNDELTGGAGADVFVFLDGFGHDRILDFENGSDRIEFGDGAYNLQSLSMSQVGGDVLIKSAGGLVTLVGVNLASLDASDFVFRLYSEEPSNKPDKKNVPEIPSDLSAHLISSEQDEIDVFLTELPAVGLPVIETEIDILLLAEFDYFDFFNIL